MPAPSVQALGAAAYALLDAHAALTTYRSIVDPAPPLDASGVLLGYAVFHPDAGDDTPNNVAATPGQLVWGFQVTCVGGDPDYVAWVVDTVRGLLTGKTLTVAATSVGVMRPPVGYQAPTRTQLELIPPRISVPLRYQLIAAS